MDRNFHAYILLCRDGTYYTGHTDDLQKRLNEHSKGEGSRHTKSRLPVKLVWSQYFFDRDSAKRAECQIKGWKRKKKQALISGNIDLLKELASRKK